MNRIGTAGWTIPAPSRGEFPSAGSQLERYAAVFNCVEINSSFYKPHRPATYARWAASVPGSFRFSVKMPKEITHARRFVECEDALARFLEETAALGDKRGAVLVQLPPSFAYNDLEAGRFFEMLRERYAGFAICEPRHLSWFSAEADALLRRFHIGRAAADPAICEAAAQPGGWPEIIYFRQHGSPRTYYSRYDAPAIDAIRAKLAASGAAERWCIFDNTGAGAATENALELVRAVS